MRFGDDFCPYRTFGFFVLPEDRIPIKIVPAADDARRDVRGSYVLLAEAGILSQIDPSRWQWKAPKVPGLYHLAAIHPSSGETMVLNVFVMVPFDSLKAGRLNGYQIGSYPHLPSSGDFPWMALSLRYAAPMGFIEVTRQNEETLISPHFQLNQFLCKQPGGYPKYLVLRETLLLKLEKILEEVNRFGIVAETFAIMSGYRTPFYNAAIGDVKYSRHQWGDAADIYVDEKPRDEMMDDLNRDGRIDARDSRLLYDWIDRMQTRADMIPLVGGIGWYDRTRAHGPFVHVDTRGRPARWSG